jgi:hypothetical protein
MSTAAGWHVAYGQHGVPIGDEVERRHVGRMGAAGFVPGNLTALAHDYRFQ